MTARRVLAVLLVLALAHALPSADAHISGFSQARSLTVGPYLAYLSPSPETVYANATLTFSAQYADGKTGAALSKHVPSSIQVGGPGAFHKTLELVDDGAGYQVASLTLPSPGNYTARLIVEADGKQYTNDTDFRAYPDLPVRIAPADTAQDIVAGSRVPLVIETRDPITLQPHDIVKDLTVRVEHWSEDHKTMYAYEDMTANRTATGTWRFEYRFGEAGMYHMRFASTSGAFGYDDVPLLHLYATPRSAADKPAPGPSLAAVAVGLVAAYVVVGSIRRK